MLIEDARACSASPIAAVPIVALVVAPHRRASTAAWADACATETGARNAEATSNIASASSLGELAREGQGVSSEPL